MDSATTRHAPVLRDEIVIALAVRPRGTYIDATVGAGGHAFAILEASGPDGHLLGIDCDPAAIQTASARLARYGDRITFARSSFARLAAVATACGFVPSDGIVMDLGLSSDQLADAKRGLSFMVDGPLDMRLDPDIGQSAADLVNGLRERELADLIYQHGEERRSRQIAKAIVAARPVRTTLELAALVSRSVPGRPGGIHPATRTFQALRIAVNSELQTLAAALPQAISILAPYGRLAIISFHSLEDRIVKRLFATESRRCICPPELPECRCDHEPTLRLIAARPIVPSAAETTLNPRARSARLRVAERLVSGEPDHRVQR